ncbi:MAG: YbaK/EbsC family protein [Acidobacteriia bacterium]|nr:YbaK/EbsC family protein [Terriglobia bacterium]
MTMPSRLKAHLEQAHVSYTRIPHIPARSSQYAASLLHVPGREVAKTVALRAGKQVVLAVLPASYRVDLEKLAGLVGAPVQLIGEEECSELFPDCQSGAVPPFGELYGLPVYLDEALAEDPEIVFSAGTLSDGIRMGNADFVHLVKPRICSFANRGNVIREDDLQDVLSTEEGGGK